MRKWIAVAAIAFLVLQAPTVAFEILFALVPVVAVVIAFKIFTSPNAVTVRRDRDPWVYDIAYKDVPGNIWHSIIED